MKNSFRYLLFFLILAFIACDKEEVLENKLEGTWELRHLRGTNLAPNTPENYARGNGNVFKFRGNTFEHQIGGKAVDTGTFSVLKEDSNYNENLEFKLVINGNKYHEIIPFKLSKKTLILHFGSLASDGAIGTYAKL